jgi:hypothetical protein
LPENRADHIERRQPVKRPKTEGFVMHIRTRKLVGTVALLTLVTLWALLAMAFAQFALRSASGIVAALFYVVAGLGWVLPAMPLVAWMVRPDKVTPTGL